MSAVLRSVSRRTVLPPVAGAVAVVALAATALDAWGETVLRGAVILLAVAAAAAVDEPDARLLDASPTVFVRRVLGRLAVVAAVVVPVALLLAGWVRLAGGDVPRLLALELLALAVAATGLAAALRRWTALAEPAVVVAPVVVGGIVLFRGAAPALLPDTGLTEAQGWTVALALAAALLVAALREPATAVQRRLPRLR